MHETWTADSTLQPYLERGRAERSAAIRGIVRAVTAAFGNFSRGLQKRRMIAELQALDDRSLKDIGLYRNDIGWLATERWGRPDGRLPDRPSPRAAEVVQMPPQPERLKRAA